MNNNAGLVRPLMPPQVNFLLFLPVTAPPKHSFKGLIHRLRDVALDDANPLGKALATFTLCFFFLQWPREASPTNPYIFSPETHGPAINFTLKERYGCPSSQNDTYYPRSVSSTDAPLTTAYLLSANHTVAF